MVDNSQAAGFRPPRTCLLLGAMLLVAVFHAPASAAELDVAAVRGWLKQFCFECHAGAAAEGQIDLERMSGASFASGFKGWQKAAAMLEQSKMPPAEAKQPSAEERRKLAGLLREELARAIREHAGDPGPLVLRRLT